LWFLLLTGSLSPFFLSFLCSTFFFLKKKVGEGTFLGAFQLLGFFALFFSSLFWCF
jgi:hypothetical protein